MVVEGEAEFSVRNEMNELVCGFGCHIIYSINHEANLIFHSLFCLYILCRGEYAFAFVPLHLIYFVAGRAKDNFKALLEEKGRANGP